MEKRTLPIRSLGTPPPVPLRTVSLKDSVCRETMSEEDLVSKTAFLASPNCLSVGANTTIVSYHSEESVFNQQPESKLESRSPSYIKISCALSGYRNYRGSREPITSPHLRSPGGGTPTNSPLVNKCSDNLWPSQVNYDRSQKENVCPMEVKHLPRGKSIVETRVERFQVPMTNGEHSHPKATENSVSDAVTPTPIKNIISNFNKLNLQEDVGSTPTGRPKSKVPPPVPTKGPRRISKSTSDTDSLVNGIEQHQVELSPTNDASQAVVHSTETNGHESHANNMTVHTNGYTDVCDKQHSGQAVEVNLNGLRVPSVEQDELCEAPTVSPAENQTAGQLYLAKLRVSLFTIGS